MQQLILFCSAVFIAVSYGAESDSKKNSCDGNDVFYCDTSGGECVHQQYVCNGVSECSTGKDEAIDVCGCLDNEFQCNATACIDIIKRCDRSRDCEDGIDEEDCAMYFCPLTHFKCKNFYCIPSDQKCNFIDDCGDNSDESTCKYPDCFDTQFRCDNRQCIDRGFVCDGEIDCADGSDEKYCHTDRFFICDYGLHLDRNLTCDGWLDCEIDHTDEINCGNCSTKEVRCSNGRCIKEANVCDGICDCLETCDDELDCESLECKKGQSYICPRHRCIDAKFLCDGHNDCYNTKYGADEYFCWNISYKCQDFPSPWTKFVCPEGRCLPSSGPDNVVCNQRYDCINGEDELGCEYEPCSENEFQCKIGQCIDKKLRCNGKFDCNDRSDEIDCRNYICPDGHEKCRDGACVPREKFCDFHRDCIDGSDEKDCEAVTCLSDQFRCNNGQCIPLAARCYNGKLTNTTGCVDKSHLRKDLCRNWRCRSDQYKCRNSYCIDADQRCDLSIDCMLTSDDEHGCPVLCPYKVDVCLCVNDKMDCGNRELFKLPNNMALDDGVSKFNFTGNFLNISLNKGSFQNLTWMLSLDLSNNFIREIPVGMFSTLWRLSVLNLQNNKIETLKNGTFIGLTNLGSLDLRRNIISDIQPFAFTGLSSLSTLDLSSQEITSIQQSSFVGLRSLFSLDLSNNKITFIEDGAFSGLPNLIKLDLRNNILDIIENNVFHGLPSLSLLYFDEFRFCCLASHVSECYPPADEFSSCDNLMSNYVLRVSIWILGVSAFLGNILVVAWRVRDFRIGKVHSFLITNLAIGDFFMGVYLLIIAVVDTHYRGIYFIYDKSWRESFLCKFAGFISTFSSELSVFTLTVITIDRLICIIFPLKLRRLGLKEAFTVMPCIWILVFLLSALPLMGLDYFSNFYGRSGVCLALHITPEKPQGWEYSVFVFLVLNFVSFLVIFISYLWMFMVARKTTTAVRKSKAKSDKSMAKRMTLIVMSDFLCWVPIIILGFCSLGGAKVPTQVYAWIAVFVLPFNSAINPILYTISTAQFMRNIRKKASRFKKSFTGSLRSSDTKNSFIGDDRFSHSGSVHWGRNSMYRQLELTRLRDLKKSYSLHNHGPCDKAISSKI